MKTRVNPDWVAAHYELVLVDQAGRPVPTFNPMRFDASMVGEVIARMNRGEDVMQLAIPHFLNE